MLKTFKGAASQPSRRRKPSNLIFDVDETPGKGTLVLLGLQHIILISLTFVFPVVLVDAIGGTSSDASAMISMAMLASGLGTILQGLNRGSVGSGYLCPVLSGPAFISASLLAGKTGGLSLVFGMTAVAGFFESLFARILTRTRIFFPVEVTGTIVLMVGIELIPLAIPKFMGVDRTHLVPDAVSIGVALITLLAMTSFNVWGKGKLRLYSVLLGMFVGFGAAYCAGIFTTDHISPLQAAPYFSFPSLGRFGLSFKAALLVPFLIAALSSALKTMGDVTTCQKVNDAQWKRPDMASLSGGVMACGIANIASGLLGALGQSVSSSNVGLSVATGATSRRIAYCTGAILIFLAFCPKLAAVFVIMPTPIMGASLFFSACFMLLAGIQIITSRMLDARRTFVIGFSIIFGLSVEFAPAHFAQAPAWLQPICASSLSLAAICAVTLNLFFRIGIRKTETLRIQLPEGNGPEKIYQFMDQNGRAWGARSEVIYKATAALTEFFEAASAGVVTPGPIEMKAHFDEHNVDLEIAYPGDPIELPSQRPDIGSLLGNENGLVKLSGYLMRQFADKVAVDKVVDTTHIRLGFVH